MSFNNISLDASWMLGPELSVSTVHQIAGFRSELFGTLVLLIVAQTLSYGFELVLQLWDKLRYMCMLAGTRMLSIEDDRQYRAPHLPADLVVSCYETSG
ncbi:hypothetical protein F511_19869 [Dorcoceras hygrometricum]|uniref:Uncharacterized protein n=1 Tax=Dorcoceras hygrometricum TaxID=472368 RepID=A0A2Z7AYM2_9LAMI|nr:hypothetical protein F511_19869 [Dorcoceras hygrometricum]